MSEVTRKPNSFELAAGVQALLAEGAEGFDADDALTEWEQRLAAQLDRCGDKIEACAAIYRRAVAEVDFQAQEAQRRTLAVMRATALSEDMKVRIGALLRAQEDLTGNAMAVVGVGWVKLARRNSTRCEVPEDVDALPMEYVRVKTEADKAKIKKVLEAGGEVAGCSLVKVVSESVTFSK